MKKIISFLLALGMFTGCFCAFGSMIVRADDEPQQSVEVNEKVYSQVKIDKDFEDDSVIVIINNQTSLKFHSYSIQDFSEINCKSVEDLTPYAGRSIEEKKNYLSTNNERSVSKKKIDASKYKQILYIKLDKHSKQGVINTIKILETRQDIYYVGPNYQTVKVCSMTPNDSYYGSQWAINNISLPQAWGITTGSSSVNVGIIDTGIDGNHPDLIGKVHSNLCRDFLNGNSTVVYNPTDPSGHGTHVAGIIGANTNNNAGVSGVCWNVKLVSLRAFNPQGVGSVEDIVRAINFASEEDIPILNMSFECEEGAEELRVAIDDYYGLVVCAAGNDNNNNDIAPKYPHSLDCENIISVGASTRENTRWYSNGVSASNYGKTKVDLFAPGLAILSCYSTSVCSGSCTSTVYDHCFATGYHTVTGTSMAAPYVTGVAALLLAKDAYLSAIELKRAIINNVDEFDSLTAYCVSGGRLNAYKALTNASHNYTYTNLGISSGHRCTCADCGHSFTESHNWINFPTFSRCSDCGARSEFVTRP